MKVDIFCNAVTKSLNFSVLSACSFGFCLDSCLGASDDTEKKMGLCPGQIQFSPVPEGSHAISVVAQELKKVRYLLPRM